MSAGEILTVQSGNKTLGFDFRVLYRVIPMEEVKQVSGSSSHVYGLIRYNGKIIPVFLLGSFFGQEGTQEDTHSRIVIIEKQGRFFSFIVDSVGDTSELPEKLVFSSDRDVNHLVKGEIQSEGSTILVIDDEGLYQAIREKYSTNS